MWTQTLTQLVRIPSDRGRTRVEMVMKGGEQEATLSVSRYNGFTFNDGDDKNTRKKRRTKAEEAAALSDEAESKDNFDWIYQRVKGAARARQVEASAHEMTRATMEHLTKEGFSFQRRTRPAPTRKNWNANETYYVIYW